MFEPIVTIEQGQVLGRVSQDYKAKPFFSFQGIRYGKPPTGDLRFKAPQPAEAWSGIFDATKEGNQCYCRDFFFKDKIGGSEDCLILNVYTPNLPSPDLPLKPVMVFVHGGAFISGSSSTDIYGPEYLVTQDIVLVTINYRVGIFGFFNLKDTSLGVTGNAGLKDQVLALKWVQKNIKHFGGDPGNVTIFGESAGGASVHFLVLSQLTKNLFHRAIAQSGLAIHSFSYGRNTAPEIAEILKLNTTHEKEILECLQKMSFEEVYEVSLKVPEPKTSAPRPFVPVVEPNVEGAFITEDPIKILNSGHYNQVPMIFGYTTREGMLIEILRGKPLTMPDDFEDTIPFVLGLKRGSQESKIVAEKIKRFYYGDGESIDTNYLLASDEHFIREIIFGARRTAQTSKAPVFLYRMSVESEMNMLKKLANLKHPGVCHADDLGYLFKTKVSPKIKEGSLEDISVQRFLKLWTNFAKNGDPNPKQGDQLIPVHWKPVTKTEINFLDIGEKLSVDVNPEAERVAFWDQIYNLNPVYKI